MSDWRVPSNRTPAMALRHLLAARLRFGDSSQIEALFILRKAEELLETNRECPGCEGKGEIEYHQPGHCDRCGRECACCTGTADIEECEMCKGTGETTWSHDEVYALRPDRLLQLLEKPESEAA